MSYYSQFFFQQEKKIPTAVSLVVILLVGLLMMRIFSFSPTLSKASKQSLKQLKIVNLNSNEATIIWETEDKATSWIIYGENERNLDKNALDERDLANKREKRQFHFVYLKNLKSESTYYFKIVTEKQLIENTGGSAFTFKTLISPLTNSNLKPLYGKIVNIDGLGLANAIVLFSINGNSTLAVLTKTSGEWLMIPRFEKTISTKEKVQIQILEETGKKTIINAYLSNLSPLPQTVIIGQNYNFFQEENDVLSAETKISGKKPEAFDIIFPKEKMIIPGNDPLIKGTALPNEQVFIFVQSPVAYTFRTKADNNGQWKIMMPEALNTGEHTITMTTKDYQGKEIKVIRKFTIAKSGEQVLGYATGSATPTLAPVTTVTLIPTISTTFSSPTQSPPVSGGNINVLSTVSGGLIIIGLGIMLAF